MLFLFLTACQSELKTKVNSEIIIEPKQIQNGEYKLCGKNLYKDHTGNLYFRTIDRSAINEENEVFACYSNKLRYDTMVNNKKEYLEMELKNVVDPSSFKQIREKGPFIYFQDNKHEYMYLQSADGGTLHCIK